MILGSKQESVQEAIAVTQVREDDGLPNMESGMG